MGPMIVFVVVAAVALLWVRSTRVTRRRWLQQLNLPGLWELESEGPRGVLEFRGDLSHGEYLFRQEANAESGEWRLIGHTLSLTPAEGAASDYELRFFDAGKIGIDGPGHERQIFNKRPDNVVPLRARS